MSKRVVSADRVIEKVYKDETISSDDKSRLVSILREINEEDDSIVTAADTTVELVEFPTGYDWDKVKDIALKTMNKKMVNPSDMAWRRMMIRSCHSPLRDLKFKFVLKNVPYWVHVELVRHHEGVQPYVGTQRNDRQDKYDRRFAPQAKPVQMVWTMNGEALIILARKRLCGKATDEAQRVIQKIVDAVYEKCPEYIGFLVPNCCWQGGICHEPQCCGRNRLFGNGEIIGSAKWDAANDEFLRKHEGK